MKTFGFVLLVFLPMGVFAHNSGQIADRVFGVGADARKKTFSGYVQQLEQFKMPSLRGLKRLGTDWQKELERSRSRFEKAQTKEDVYYALLSLQRSFHDAHSRFRAPVGFAPKEQNLRLPFRLEVESLGGRRVYRVSRSEDPAIKPGWILKSLDGKSPDVWETEFREWTSNHSPEALWLETARKLVSRRASQMPLPSINSRAELVFTKGGAGSMVQATVQTAGCWKLQESESPEPEPPCGDAEVSRMDYSGLRRVFTGLNHCVYEGKVGSPLVIRAFSFDYDWSAEELRTRTANLSYRARKQERVDLASIDAEELGRFLKKKKPRSVLIDVRENGGGGLPTRFIGLFAKTRFAIQKRQALYAEPLRRDPSLAEQAFSMADRRMKPLLEAALRRGDAQSPALPFFCKTEACSDEEIFYEPVPDSFVPSQVFVLTGPHCSSSCDQFAAIMAENRLARLIGVPPMGATSPFRVEMPMKLLDGSTFSVGVTVGEGIRMGGILHEGNPPEVHHRLEFQDRYLAQAMHWVRSQSN
jgi:hypothetical protein